MLLMTEKPEQLKRKTFTLQTSNAIVMATVEVRNFWENLAHYTAMNIFSFQVTKLFYCCSRWHVSIPHKYSYFIRQLSSEHTKITISLWGKRNKN